MPQTALGLVRMDRCAAGFFECLREIHELKPDRIEHRGGARCTCIEVIAKRLLEHRRFHPLTGFRDADALAKKANRRRCVAAPAQSHECRHARIVPAVDRLRLHQLLQLALAGNGVGHVQARKLDLPGQRPLKESAFGHPLQDPVIKRPMVLEFERAQRVGDVLERVRQRMRIVVHWIDRPGVACAMVMGMANPIQDRVAQIDIRRAHVDAGTQHMRALGLAAGAHLAQKREALCGGSIAKSRVGTRFGQGAAMFADLIGALRVDIGMTRLHQVLGKAIKMLEVVACVIESGLD